MKGQTQALTAVLITFITITAISTAYIWGTPLLEKQESKSELNNLEQNMRSLHSTVISTSKSGSGTTNRIEIGASDSEITINESNDYIQVETQAIDPPYPSNTWTLLEGDNVQNLSIGAGSYGIKDEDLPGVVAVTALSGSSNTLVRYRVEFRNLKSDNPPQIEKIDLQATGGNRASGPATILLTNKGLQRDSNFRAGPETFDRARTVIEVDLQ